MSDHPISQVAWPAPADPDAAARLVDRFADLGAPEREMATDPAARRMLDAVGGGSPYLADLVIREHATVLRVWVDGPDAALATIIAALDALPANAARPLVSAGLREAKRRIALVCALGRYRRPVDARPRHRRAVPPG